MNKYAVLIALAIVFEQSLVAQELVRSSTSVPFTVVAEKYPDVEFISHKFSAALTKKESRGINSYELRLKRSIYSSDGQGGPLMEIDQTIETILLTEKNRKQILDLLEKLGKSRLDGDDEISAKLSFDSKETKSYLKFAKLSLEKAKSLISNLDGSNAFMNEGRDWKVVDFNKQIWLNYWDRAGWIPIDLSKFKNVIQGTAAKK